MLGLSLQPLGFGEQFLGLELQELSLGQQLGPLTSRQGIETLGMQHATLSGRTAVSAPLGRLVRAQDLFPILHGTALVMNPPPHQTPWRSLLDELALLDRARLVNGLAVGLGTTALMARRILRNDGCGQVAWAVVAAHNALARSLPLLPPELLVTDDGFAPLPDILSLPATSWDSFLMGLPPADQVAIQQAIQEAVGGVSQATRALTANQPAGSVVAPLLTARSALTRLHGLLRPPLTG